MIKRVMPRKKEGKPGWFWRRLIIFPAVLFIGWRMVALEGAMDTRVNDQLAYGYSWLFAVLILGYAGLASIQDVAAIWATRSALPYAPQQQPEPDPSPSANQPAVIVAPVQGNS